MSAILAKVRREPALLVAFVTAVLILLTEFGVDLTAGQQASIVGVIIAIGAIIVRQSVTPNISVGALEDDQGNPNAEQGAYDAGNLLVALAAIVVVLCGLEWLLRNL